MRLKSYFAATVEAAMNLARLELGDDAMLVSTKKTGEDAANLGQYEVVFATSTYPAARGMTAAQRGAADPSFAARARPLDKLSDEVASLKREMERLASALSRSTVGIGRIAANPHLSEIFSQLTAAELDAAIAQDVIAGVASRLDSASSATDAGCRRAVAAELQRLLPLDNSAPGIAGKNATVVVGPSGAGKTATLVKLAVLYGLCTRRPSQILSLDTHRVAATEPLRSYAAIAGIGFAALETPRELAQALEEYRSKELVFIDTPALAGMDSAEAADMARLVSRHPQMETHLVLNAAMKPADMKRMAMEYEMFGPARLIFTHLDATATFGPLLTLSFHTGKPISFLSRGPEIPEDLEPAERVTLIELVLGEGTAGRDELITTAVA